MGCRIEEAVAEEVSSQMTAVKFNLGRVLGGLLYSLKLELEKKGGVGDLENLVRLVVDSTRYDGPEGEEYPAWDEDSKEAKAIVGRIEETLRSHGIEQAWNIGRKT